MGLFQSNKFSQPRPAPTNRIWSTENKDTELRLIALMRAAGITDWRRGASLRVEVRSRKLKDLETAPASRRPTSGLRILRSLRETSPPTVATIRPDFVFPKQRLAVFVDGCFFHGCPKHATWPKNNAAFWKAKIEGNIARDLRQTRLLRAHGWTVLRIWEHALTARHAAHTLARLRRVLVGNSILTA